MFINKITTPWDYEKLHCLLKENEDIIIILV